MTVYSIGYRVLIVFLVLFSGTFSYAQRERIDSLREILPRLQGLQKIDGLNKLSELYRNLGIYDTSSTYALESERGSARLKYQRGTGEALYNLASIDYEISDFATMEERCRQAIDVFKGISATRDMARSYSLLGQAIWAQSKFDKANEAFNTAKQLFIQSGDSTGLGNAYALMALAEEERGNYEKSLEYCLKALPFDADGALIALGQLYADVGDYETALDYYARVKDSNLRTYTNLKVGETFHLKKWYDSARYYYQSYIDRRGRLSKNMLSKPYALLGGLYHELKNYDSALFYLTAALTDFKKVNNQNWVMRVWLELGKTYLETGKSQQAFAHAHNLLEAAQESGARQYARDAHYLLFQLYEGAHRQDSAYSHLRKFTDLNNTIAIDVSARKLAFYKSSNERQKAKLKIDLLDKERQLQEEELKQTAQQRGFLFISIVGLLITGFVLGRNVLLKKKNEAHLRELAENELRIQKLESKKQLGELEMQILRTQMSPHFIFNSLNSINRYILQNNKFQASEYLSKFSRLVRMILQDSQSKSITLERELESLELYLSLESLRFENHFTYNITIPDDVDVSGLHVPPLIIQPYVENAVWHGLMHKEEKGRLSIDIYVESEFLFIKIVDDGIGRDRATRLAEHSSTDHKSMGLGITSQRIAMAQEQQTPGPSVFINDLVDAGGEPCGTEVILKLPVTHD